MAIAMVPLCAVAADTAAGEPVIMVHESSFAAGHGDQDAGRRLAEALAEDMGGTIRLESMPAARFNALLDAGQMRLCAVFQSRTPERETLRRWVAEISRGRTFLIARAADGTGSVPVEPGPADPVVVLDGSSYETAALRLGYRVEPVKTRQQIFQMFSTGRVRYWLEDAATADTAQRQNLVPPYTVVRDLGTSSGWVACSLAVEEETVLRLQVRMQDLRGTGRLQDILSDAGLPHPVVPDLDQPDKTGAEDASAMKAMVLTH
jgi:ABC-type amino acid transport substrate-binding protein